MAGLLLFGQIFILLFPLMAIPTNRVTDSDSESESAEEEDLCFPTSLEEFGYAFNTDGQLRKLDERTGEITAEGFEFEVRPGNREYNQKRYVALGEVINQEIYQLLESKAGLVKTWVGEENEEYRSFVFASPDLRTNSDKLLILINGAGAVRGGQWSRKLIINNGLDEGSMLGYIERAKSAGYAVLVMNTNHNRVGKNSIPGSETPVTHARTVWEQFVTGSPSKFIAVVAHSYGGIVAVDLAEKFKLDLMERVGAFLLTDSVHHKLTDDDSVNEKLQRIGINYVCSKAPLDTVLPKYIMRSDYSIPRVSSGSNEHIWTSFYAMESVMRESEKLYMNSTENQQNDVDL